MSTIDFYIFFFNSRKPIFFVVSFSLHTCMIGLGQGKTEILIPLCVISCLSHCCQYFVLLLKMRYQCSHCDFTILDSLFTPTGYFLTYLFKERSFFSLTSGRRDSKEQSITLNAQVLGFSKVSQERQNFIF